MSPGRDAVKVFTRNGISWFLEDREGLAAVVEDLVEETGTRRTYAIRRWGDREVFIKFFLERGVMGSIRNRIVPRGKKEYFLGKEIASLSVATPLPLGYGVGAGGSFVLQERIGGTTFRSAFYENPDRQPLLDALARLLNQMQTQRIRHNDLHLDNVIVSGGVLYLIDLHKTGIKRSRFSMKDQLVNLSEALNMIYSDMTEREKDGFFRAYGRPEVRPMVEARLGKMWEEWTRSKKKRSFSTTSKLLATGNRVYVRGREDKGGGYLVEVIKKDTKVMVERRSDHIRKIYRDRRRLRKAWETHVVLEYTEWPLVPRPFLVETDGLFGGGYVALEDLGGQGEELDRFLDREYDGMSHTQRRRFVEDFSRFLSGFLTKAIIHSDLKACNVFVIEDGFRLLDVEDIVFHAPEEKDLKRMLVQVNASIPRRIADTDRMRLFVKLTRSFPFDRKRLFRDVVRASLAEEIVYEGASGLRRESWQGRP